MKKSELRAGAEYALSSTSKYDRLRGVKVTVVEVEGARRRANGTTVKGIVVTGEGDLRRAAGYVSAGEVEQVPSGEWVVRSGRYLREPWAAFAEKVAAAQERERERDAERERRRQLTAEVTVELADCGFELVAGYGMRGDASVDAASGKVTMSLDSFAWLVRKLNPVEAVESVLAELDREPRPRDEDDYFDRVDSAKARLRRRLAMSREDERAEGEAFEAALAEPAPEDVYAQDFDEATDRAVRSGGGGPV